MPAGIADDQSKDFDFEKTEMKYDSTGMFHWSPARNLEDCILVSGRQFRFSKWTCYKIIIYKSGSKSSGDDSAEWPRGRVLVCGSWFAVDRPAESGDAVTSF